MGKQFEQFATKNELQLHEDKNKEDLFEITTKIDHLRNDLMNCIHSIDRDINKLTGQMEVV